MPNPPASSIADVRYLVTAEEAYPAFEEAVMDARAEVIAGFRIFDFSTRLRSPRAQRIGRDWFDLLLDALRRGVRIEITLSDFDPVVGEGLHAQTWRSLRVAAALAEVMPRDADLTVRAAMHPARLTPVGRVLLWPRVQMMLGKRVGQLNRLAPEGRHLLLRDRPLLARQIRKAGNDLAVIRRRLPDLAPVTHHQKVAVIDRRVLYCGGLDLNERRFDTKAHDRPAEQTWHDVQVLIHDPEVAEAARAHLREFVGVTHRDCAPRTPDGVTLRTISGRARKGWRLMLTRRVLTEIETEVLGGIAEARTMIYIETQFLRDRRVARALARAARRWPSLQLFIVLPAAPEDVAFEKSDRSDARFGEFLQARCVATIRRAFGRRCLIASPVQPTRSKSKGRDSLFGSPVVYVHSKVCIFDDRTAILSSANLNGRSLRMDTEFGVHLRGAKSVLALRERLLAHWLAAGKHVDGSGTDIDLAEWQRRIRRNASAQPDQREGFLVPYLSKPGERFGQDLPGVPEDIV
ncbi:MAG: phospholipase D-like domain-containing protein [Jannaschia sp.]